MKAIILKEKGSIENLLVEDIPKPAVQPDEVLVKVYAAGVNPVDWKAAVYGYFEMPHISGTDIAGVIEAVGSAVTAFKAGDEIIGSLEWKKQGAFTEYVATKPPYITHKPKNLNWVEAAAVPLASLTAWQALFDHGHLQQGQKAVIQAAAGGVGLFAVQFAKWKGAYVVGTASEVNDAFVKSFGADEVVDYHTTKLTDKVMGADLVLDSVATSEVQEESFKALKNGGHYVSITAGPREEILKQYDINATKFLFISNPVQLQQIVALIEQGIVKVHIDKTFPLVQAKEALEYVRKGRTRGKVVLTVE